MFHFSPATPGRFIDPCEMDSAVVSALIILLVTHVNDVAASCREVQNDDMREYLCEGGHPGDLATVPETTEKLRISRMPLRRITADTFAKFGGNLWVLSCSHCEISDIEPDAFRRLVNLQQLSLDNNYLTTVKATWFQGLDSLTYLDVNYNDIHDIDDGVYQNLPALVDFRVSGNRLRCLNLDGMSHLRQLKRMFLSENPEFACPHAISEFLENQRVTFERDPEWNRLAQDAIKVHIPPVRVTEEKEEEEARDRISVPVHRERLHPDRQPSYQPEAPVVPPLAGDRMFHPAEHYGRRRRPMTTTTTTSTTIRPIMLQSHIPRVEPIPPAGGARTSHQTPPEQPQSSRPMVFYPYLISGTPRVPFPQPRPPLEDARMSVGADEPPLTEDTSMYPSHVPIQTTSYPSYVTSSERSQPPSIGSRPSPEEMKLMTDKLHQPPFDEATPTMQPPLLDHRGDDDDDNDDGDEKKPTTVMKTTDRISPVEHTLTYPAYVPRHETTSAYPQGSRVPLMESRQSSEGTTELTARPDRPMLTEHTLTYPPYEPTHEDTSHPSLYVTSERSRVPIMESKAPSEEKATIKSDGSSTAAEDTVTYPLYVATSDGTERIAHGSIQITRPRPSSDSDMSVTFRTWSSDDSMQPHPQNAEHHQEQSSSWPVTNMPTSRQETPQRMSHEPNGRDYAPDDKDVDNDRLPSSTGRFFIATDLPVERGETERSRTIMTTSSNDEDPDKDMHYARPVPASYPETIHPVSTDEFYQAPYQESSVTMHPPLLDYRGYDEDQATIRGTTTDKPLPDCPEKGSAPRSQPASVLVMSIVVAIFGHVVVAVF